MESRSDWNKRNISVLSFLTLVNLFNYFDRFVLVALLPAIQKEMGLTDTQLGFLGTAFMLVYFATSPIFGWLGDRLHRFRLMSFGVFLWSLATAVSGMTNTYATLLMARAGVGIGEASYVAVSPVLLGDYFKKVVRGRAFAIFFMAIPVGAALGYLLGGLLEKNFGWRHALFAAGGPGLLLAIALLFLRDPPRGQFDGESEPQTHLPLREIASRLWANRTYVFTVAGYIAYTFVVGGVSFWMPAYLVRFFGMELANSNMLFGAITVVAGFSGTILGGAWADRSLRTDPHAYLKISGISALVAAAAFALVLMMRDLTAAMILIFVLEFFLFVSTSPVNAQIVNCVPAGYRATANAASVFLIHLFGDAISPSLIGFLSDTFDLRQALFLGPIGIGLAGSLWFFGTKIPKTN